MFYLPPTIICLRSPFHRGFYTFPDDLSISLAAARSLQHLLQEVI